MRLTPLALAALAPGLSSLACGDAPTPRHLAWPDDVLPFALLLELDERGHRVVHGPFRAPGEAAIWSERESARLVLAGLGEAALRQLHPRVDTRAAGAAFAVEPTAETCDRGRALSLSDASRSFPLPIEALTLRTLHGTTTEAELGMLRQALGGWSLIAPLETESCAEPEPTASPFGATLEIIPAGTVLAGRAREPTAEEDRTEFFELRSAAWLSDESVAIATWERLFWLERGGSVAAAEDRMLACAGLAPVTLGGSGWRCWSLARGPSPEAPLILGLSENEPRRGAIVFIDVRSGRFEVDSSSIAVGRHVNVVAIDDAGHILVGAREGWLGYGTVNDGMLGWAQLPNELTSVDHVLPLSGPEPTFLVAASGGSSYRLAWPDVRSAQRIALPGDPTSPTAIARLPGNEEAELLFLRSFVDPLVSPDAVRWSSARMEVPAVAARCARAPDACAHRSFVDIVDVAGPLDHRSFVLAPRHCTSLFRYDPRKSCIEPILPPGQTSIESVPPERWRGTRQRGDKVLVFGDRARVLELAP